MLKLIKDSDTYGMCRVHIHEYENRKHHKYDFEDILIKSRLIIWHGDTVKNEDMEELKMTHGNAIDRYVYHQGKLMYAMEFASEDTAYTFQQYIKCYTEVCTV